jgi:NTP pyrophosphatase (non-canonical NTP hydrolase)
MKVEEYLMVRLMEELAEMSHAASKCIRFGPKHIWEGRGKSNVEKLRDELGDVFAVLAALDQFGVNTRTDLEYCKEKSDELLIEIVAKVQEGLVEDWNKEDV